MEVYPYTSKVFSFQREHNLGLELDTSESEAETCMMTRPTEPLAKRDRYKYRFCDYCEIQVVIWDISDLSPKTHRGRVLHILGSEAIQSANYDLLSKLEFHYSLSPALSNHWMEFHETYTEYESI